MNHSLSSQLHLTFSKSREFWATSLISERHLGLPKIILRYLMLHRTTWCGIDSRENCGSAKNSSCGPSLRTTSGTTWTFTFSRSRPEEVFQTIVTSRFVFYIPSWKTKAEFKTSGWQVLATVINTILMPLSRCRPHINLIRQALHYWWNSQCLLLS